MNTEDILKTLSDEELVSRIVKDNDSFPFGELYDRYAKIVYNKCHSFSKSEDEAKDLTQDVFLLLFIKLRTFKGRSKFATWLYSFTYNFCTNHVNRNKERQINNNSKSLNQDAELSSADVTDEILLQIRVSRLKKALDIIPPEDKSILLLKYQDGITIKDLTELMDLNESAVKMRLKRAKIKIIEAHNKLH